MKGKQIMQMYAYAMLAYQAWRVFDYMKGSIQGVDDLTKTIVAIAFLSFSEVGLLIWLHYGSKNSNSDAQEFVSTFMMWADFIGSMIIGLADILKHNTLYVVDLSILDPILLITPWLMVVLNVGGFLVYFTTDSEEQVERAQRALEHEENMLRIETRRAAVKQLRQQKAAVIGEMAPLYADDARQRVVQQTRERFQNNTALQTFPSESAVGPDINQPERILPQRREKTVDCAGRHKHNCMMAYVGVYGVPSDWTVVDGKAYCPDCASRENFTNQR